MAYSTQADLELKIAPDLLAQLTDDVSGTTTDTGVVNRAIADADSQINSFARGKGSPLPFSPVPDSVRRWSVGLSIFNLYARRIDLQIPDVVKAGHDDIIVELKALRDNKILIDAPDTDANQANMYVSKGDGVDKKRIFTTNNDQTGRLDRYYKGPKFGVTS